ncbi:uncharacterized protein LTR77_002485 [Saxophila tyrrhenica]|uniref:Amino acid transporter n=1 Tax=Saxophila tyrrhenica TaxID=1690608 RepID=A0AAV9PIR5_9PEZI|nr:hypothetical protein LTR77_002485 [Saxophila tyrrhenica]
MAKGAVNDSSTEVVELGNLRSSPERSPSSNEDPVVKIGHKPTVPRTLDKLIGLIGVNSSVVCPWPNFYFVAALNLGNGGSLGLLVGTIAATVGMAPVYLSLAEKMRKYPTAGGQYHWDAALAPPSIRKSLSYMCCCILTFTWLTFLGAAAWLFGLDVSAIYLLHTGEYHTWITFVAAVCVQLFALLVNVTWGKHMNLPETLVLVVHIVAFLLLLSLLAFAHSTGTVTSDFTITSATGWSPSFAALLSVLYATNSLAGFDCAAHIAEDTVDAGRRIPKSLLWSTSANALLCIVVALLICLTAGDVNALFAGPYGGSLHPIGSIIQLAANAARGNTALASAPFGLILPIIIMCCINTTAAASRMVFSFIRDDRNPVVQRWMASDLEKEQVPRITIVLTALSPMIWLWLNFVSSAGFLALGSQVTLSLASTYMLALSCSLYSRFYHPDLLGAESNGIFQLGKFWGSVCDTVGLCFLSLVWVLAWFPFTTPVDVAGINYAPIIVAGVVFLGMLYYATYSHKNYRNPSPDESGNYHA